MQTLDEIVGESPFFAGLDARTARADRGLRANVGFAAGDGSSARASRPTPSTSSAGRVALETTSRARGASSIETLEPGEVIGWSWLFPPYRWHFDARARRRPCVRSPSTAPASAASARPTPRSATS